MDLQVLEQLSEFAPAKRADEATVAAEHRSLASKRLIEQLLDSFPEPAFVLNRERQIVFANNKLAGFVDGDRNTLLGRRVGEILKCIHAKENAHGCGTTRFCSQCGAARATLKCGQSRLAQIDECRLTCTSSNGPEALDFRVWATPLDLEGYPFTIFAIRDITDEKRRAVLERLFFHDLLNTAGGLQGIMTILPELEPEEAISMSETARNLAEELVEQIRAQRDMAAAERGDLRPTFRRFDALLLLMRLCVSYGHHTVALEKHLAQPDFAGERMVHSNEALLSRVLGNLIKNALEASSPGQTVRVGLENFGTPTFTVHNEGSIPDHIQLQVFQRSFSTKASSGRGIGTYSVKLFTEKYLNGTVTFKSSVEEGTTFTVKLNSTMGV